MPNVYRKRRRIYNEPGHAHYLTFSCAHRWPLLSKDCSRQWFIEAIEAALLRHEYDLYAYVIMPEHAHLLVKPRFDHYDLSDFLYDVKRPVSCKAKAHLIETGNSVWLERLTVRRGSGKAFRFWLPGGGFDRNVFRAKSLTEVAEYIDNNPVRRGLAAEPADWPWSSARAHTGREPGPLAVDPIPF